MKLPKLSTFGVLSQIQEFVHKFASERFPVFLAYAIEEGVRRLIVHVLDSRERGVVVRPPDDPEPGGGHLYAVVGVLEGGEVDEDALVGALQQRRDVRRLDVLADVADGRLGLLRPRLLVQDLLRHCSLEQNRRVLLNILLDLNLINS